MPYEHRYQLSTKWKGVPDTKTFKEYDRSHTVSVKGKPDLSLSSDPQYKGDNKKWNPEELLLAAVSSCHMLSYLAVCAQNTIAISEYADQADGLLIVESSGKGEYKEITLKPQVVVADAAHIAAAEKLHKEAHEKCYIANSLKCNVKVVPTVNAKAKVG
jgi:peroxiredoxin-like protein